MNATIKGKIYFAVSYECRKKNWYFVEKHKLKGVRSSTQHSREMSQCCEHQWEII